MKVFINIILVFLIGFFSSTFLFAFTPVDYDTSMEVENPKNKSSLSLEYTNSKDLVNPDNIVIKHTSKNEMVLPALPPNLFKLTIIGEDNNTKKLNALSEITKVLTSNNIVISESNKLSTIISLNKDTIGLKDGNYKFILESNLIQDNNTNKITFNVIYDTQFEYTPATNLVPQSTMGLTLYYPDKEYSTVIPITRFVKLNTSLNKQVINELSQNPKDTNLTKAIDVVNSCIYTNNKKIYIDLPHQNDFYNIKASGKTAYYSLTKSMFAINKYLLLDNIQITSNKNYNENYFKDIKLQRDIKRKDIPSIYLGIRLDKKMYLVDYNLEDISVNMVIEDKIKKMESYYSENLPRDYYSPIDNDIEIINTKLVGTNLTINLSSNVLTTYTNENNKMFLIDSLVNSFTSINGINTVTILADNNLITSFVDNRDLTKPLLPMNFINPEKNNDNL